MKHRKFAKSNAAAALALPARLLCLISLMEQRMEIRDLMQNI